MTSRTLLTDLINEIAAVTEYTEPGESIRPTDSVVATEVPEDLKRLFTLRQKYGAEVMKDQLAALVGLPPAVGVARERETEFKATVLNALFWQTAALLFPPDKQELIGIRKGWVLVNPEPQSNPLSDLSDEPMIVGPVN